MSSPDWTDLILRQARHDHFLRSKLRKLARLNELSASKYLASLAVGQQPGISRIDRKRVFQLNYIMSALKRAITVARLSDTDKHSLEQYLLDHAQNVVSELNRQRKWWQIFG